MRRIVAHKLIAETAREMAAELFEHAMVHNERFRAWREASDNLPTEAIRRRYVEMAYPKLIEQARATLAALLAQPIDESLKKTIADALVLDNALQIGRQRRGAAMSPLH